MEFLFSFFSLLLGLAAANVAAGFANMWRGREEVDVGVLPPLLGLFILLVVADQWIIFWESRSALSMGPWQMLSGMALALPYNFVSTAMYPQRPQSWSSLEAYCLSNNRVLMGVLAIPPVVSASYSVFFAGRDPLIIARSEGPFFIIPAVLASWRHLWAQRIGATVLCGIALFRIFA